MIWNFSMRINCRKNSSSFFFLSRSNEFSSFIVRSLYATAVNLIIWFRQGSEHPLSKWIYKITFPFSISYYWFLAVCASYNSITMFLPLVLKIYHSLPQSKKKKKISSWRSYIHSFWAREHYKLKKFLTMLGSKSSRYNINIYYSSLTRQ